MHEISENLIGIDNEDYEKTLGRLKDSEFVKQALEINDKILKSYLSPEKDFAFIDYKHSDDMTMAYQYAQKRKFKDAFNSLANEALNQTHKYLQNQNGISLVSKQDMSTQISENEIGKELHKQFVKTEGIATAFDFAWYAVMLKPFLDATDNKIFDLVAASKIIVVFWNILRKLEINSFLDDEITDNELEFYWEFFQATNYLSMMQQVNSKWLMPALSAMNEKKTLDRGRSKGGIKAARAKAEDYKSNSQNVLKAGQKVLENNNPKSWADFQRRTYEFLPNGQKLEDKNTLIDHLKNHFSPDWKNKTWTQRVGQTNQDQKV